MRYTHGGKKAGERSRINFDAFLAVAGPIEFPVQVVVEVESSKTYQ